MNLRRPLNGVVVLFFVNGMAFGSWLPRLPELRDRLDLGLNAVGLILAMGGIGGLAGSAVSGFLVGRLGPKRSAVLPALLLMSLLPFIGLAPTAVVLAAVIVFAAVADVVADVGMNALAVRAQENRGRSIFTRLHAVWSLGSLGGAAISTIAVAAGVALTAQLWGVALLGVVAVVWAAGVLPDTELRPRMRGRRGVALIIAVVGAAVALVEGAPHDWSAIFLRDVLAASPAVAGAGFLCLSGGMVIGRLLGDRAVDRVGVTRSIFTGLLVVALAVVVTVLARNVALTLAALTAWGLGISVVLPLLYRLAGSHRGFGEGGGLAALTVGNRIGFTAGPYAVGSAAAISSLPIGLSLVVGAALVASVVAVASGLSD